MGRRDFYQEEKMKKYIYVFGVTLVLSIAVFLTIFVMYNKKMKKEASLSIENLGTLEGIVSNENLEATSSTSDKGINEKLNNTITNSSILNESGNNKKVNKTPIGSTVSAERKEKIISNDEKSNKIDITNTNTVVNENYGILNNTNDNTTSITSDSEELEFMAPVQGEIIKDFAKDSLIFSNTLEEWTTHPGIDIKAEKTSVVVAAEKGTVESIKNDPRYGLTVIISHSNGFKTIYSNLLTTEFVSENEIVEKGQTIATVGETASFEVAEDSHLHFEMYKEGNLVNPTIYLK